VSAPDRPRPDGVANLLGLVAVELEAERELRGTLDPVAWIERRLGTTLWSKQREIAAALATSRRVAVHSCHGVGKTFLAACLAGWWIDTHAPGEAFVVTTAPTFEQVRSVLWREISRVHARGHLGGQLNQTSWWLDGEIVALGRKPADRDPAAFQGIHARHVLVIIDEAAGIPQELWDAAASLASNAESRVLALGNPDDPGSSFATVCAPGSGWFVVGIDAFESPNFTGEPVSSELGALLVSQVWVAERAAEWGTESPLYTARVRGEFPDTRTDSVIPVSWLKACQRDPADAALAAAWAQSTPVELGVDVGAGGDRTVIYARRGARAELVWRGQTPDPMEVVGRVVQAVHATGATAVKVDVIGIGWGVVGRLVELREQGVHGADVAPVNVGAAARDPTRFVKLRDELWWDVGRELSRTCGWDLRDVDDATISQLIAPRYAPDSAGRIKVERKDETRARLGRSPDDADALLLAFYEPGEAADPDFVYGIWPCEQCGERSGWWPARPCRFCGRPFPVENPWADQLAALYGSDSPPSERRA
jgi:hypothetical protein